MEIRPPIEWPNTKRGRVLICGSLEMTLSTNSAIAQNIRCGDYGHTRLNLGGMASMLSDTVIMRLRGTRPSMAGVCRYVQRQEEVVVVVVDDDACMCSCCRLLIKES